MNGWIVVVAIVVLLIAAAVANRLGWIDLSNKSHSGGNSGGGIVGIGDEVFNPSRYEAQVELDRQTTLPAPAPVAGDGDKGMPDAAPGQYGGRMSIDLGTVRRRQ